MERPLRDRLGGEGARLAIALLVALFLELTHPAL